MEPQSVKVLVAGGFGVGKTTLVGAVSEIPPLTTEEMLTEAGSTVDDLSSIERKTSTTVALDFGRITISDEIALYLFGTPGQHRFWFMWDELARGAAGAIVLVDPRPERLSSSFEAVDFFEQRGISHIVAVNMFDGVCAYTDGEIREALDLDPATPLVRCMAPDRASATAVLRELLEYQLTRLEAPAPLTT